MPSEFERHIAMEPDDADQSKASQLYTGAKDQIAEVAQGTRDTIRENPGTLSMMALLVGMAGFALGWACGQSSARSERYWR
ncbi:MAG: hypothetical protein ACTHJQ_24420 [Rhizobiaceae bacterium]